LVGNDGDQLEDQDEDERTVLTLILQK